MDQREITGQEKKIPHRSMWDLWWTKWHWDRFFSEYLGFPLSISFHLGYIKWKSRKNFIIFNTELHNKPQGCGASVASAAGPFNKKIPWSRALLEKLKVPQLVQKFPARYGA
jgi:hypothetical protein